MIIIVEVEVMTNINSNRKLCKEGYIRKEKIDDILQCYWKPQLNILSEPMRALKGK